MSGGQRFGDPDRCAIGAEILPDPHEGCGASPAYAISWLWENSFRPLCQEHQLPAAAVFESAPLVIGQTDAEVLAQRLIGAYALAGEPKLSVPLVRERPPSEKRVPYEEGNYLALDLPDDPNSTAAKSSCVDLNVLLNNRPIAVSEVVLHDKSARRCSRGG